MRKLLGVAALLLLVLTGAAAQAEMIGVEVIGTSGGPWTAKSADIMPGGWVDVAIVVRNIPDFGLGGIQASIQSKNEKTNGVAWPVARTPGDTVLNATSRTMLLPNNFDFGPTAGALADIHAALSNPDPSDTDIDLLAFGGNQADGNQPYLPGFGQGPAGVQVEIVRFTALNPSVRAEPLQAQLNVYYTNTSGGNGGVVLTKLLSSAVDDTNGTSANFATAGDIGLPVTVNVMVPEPGTWALLAAFFGLGAIWLRRR